MKKNAFRLLITVSFLLLTQSCYAQAKIYFSIDLKQQMKDSVFVPSKYSSVVVTGNQYPFTSTNSFELKDEAPVDSVYSAEVDFPSSSTGKTLKYNFKIIRPKRGNLTERRPRLLQIDKTGSRGRMLPVAYFNRFSW